MSSTPSYERYPQSVVATVYYVPSAENCAKATAERLIAEYGEEFQEELAHWFGGRVLAHEIFPQEVLLELREGSPYDSSGADITVVITGSVKDDRKRKLAIALEEIHDYLRGYPVYQMSLLVRIQLGGQQLQVQSVGEDFEVSREKPIRHWRQESTPESDDWGPASA
jgi:hypothetical protein